MTTYLLVHSAWQRPEHWRLLASELRARGHRAVVPDLPLDVPGAGGLAVAERAVSALEGAADPVLVGHSAGCLVLPVIATQVPARLMVFIAGMVPVPGLDTEASAPKNAATPRFRAFMDRMIVHDDDSTEWPPEAAAEALFDALPPERARAEAATLRRQYYTVWDEPSPLTDWPDCPSEYVVCSQDTAVEAEWQRLVAREMLGVTPVELASGHFPFLECPGVLADLLVELDVRRRTS